MVLWMLIVGLFAQPELNAVEQRAAKVLARRGGSLSWVQEEHWILSLDVENRGRTFDCGQIRPLSRLGALRIFHGKIDESSLTVLPRLDHLELLVLLTDDLSPKSIASLARCRNLKKLDFKATGVSARHLAPMLKMKSLRRLFLYNTDLDDAAAKSLRVMTWLDELVLPSKIPPATIESLRRNMPKTDIRQS